jgi:hypothetical protein
MKSLVNDVGIGIGRSESRGLMKPRRRGISIHKVALPDGMSEFEYLHSVQYCARCGTEYDTQMAALYLTDDEDLGEDDDAQPLAVCRNRLACDGNLVQKAAECVDMVRYAMVSREPLDKLAYEYLTEAFEGLAQVFPGLEVEKPRCGQCFGPLPETVEDGSICRFCREKHDLDAARDAQP